MGLSPGWITGQIPTTAQWDDEWASKADDVGPNYLYQNPLTGATLTAPFQLGAYVIDPAGTLATLTVVAPPEAIDGQLFELSTTQAITSLTVEPNAGQGLLGGGPLLLTANSGMGWRYVIAEATWFRRF